MRHFSVYFILFAWGLAFCRPSLFAQNPPQQGRGNTIKIGVCVGISNPSAVTLLRALRMAADEINAAGGVLGKPLEILVGYTEMGSLEKTAEAIEKLCSQGIVCLISGGGSQNTLKSVEITIRKGILAITPSSTSPKISALQDNDLVWRTIASDVFQGKLAAKILDSLRYKTVGIIHGDNVYGNELRKAFSEEFERRKGKVTNAVSYPIMPNYAHYDFKPFVETLYKGKPEALYLISYDSDGAKIMTQSQDEKFLTSSYKPFVLGCDGNYNNDFLVSVEPDIIEGMTGLAYIHPRNNPNYNAFAANFKKFSALRMDSADVTNSSLAALLDIEATNSYAATGYDAVYAFAYAALKARSLRGKDVAAQMRTIANAGAGKQTIGVNEFTKASALLAQGKNINYEGASGSVEFDANGDVTNGTYILWRVAKGKFVEIGTLSFP